jgi:hypothetical protein
MLARTFIGLKDFRGMYRGPQARADRYTLIWSVLAAPGFLAACGRELRLHYLPMHLGLRLFLPFAAGYFLSYLLRNVNAIIAPELTRELGVSAADLGLLTSAYLLAFGAFQLPLGVLLDRYGPRRSKPCCC